MRRGSAWGIGPFGAALVVGTFAVVILADTYEWLTPYGTATAAAAAVAYTLLTRSLVAQGGAQSAAAWESLTHAQQESTAQRRSAQETREGMLRAQADSRTASVLIDQPSATGIEEIHPSGSCCEVPVVRLADDPQVSIRLYADLTIEVFGEQPLRLSRVELPPPFQSALDEGTPLRPGNTTLRVSITLDRVGLGSQVRGGGWSPWNAWEFPAELDFTSLNGEVTEHHHMRVMLQPIVENHDGHPVLMEVVSSLRYPHVPERHYRFDNFLS